MSNISIASSLFLKKMKNLKSRVNSTSKDAADVLLPANIS